MKIYEYKVIPAPVSGKKAKGVKGTDGRFANALAQAINELAELGWEYIRAESLPSVERVGIGRKRRETYQNMLVFRRDAEKEDVVEEEIGQSQEGFNPFRRFKTSATAATVAAEPIVTSEDTFEEDSVEIEDLGEEIAEEILEKTAEEPELGEKSD